MVLYLSLNIEKDHRDNQKLYKSTSFVYLFVCFNYLGSSGLVTLNSMGKNDFANKL